MRSRRVVRLQLVLLAVLAVALIWRVSRGTPPPDGDIVFVDLDGRTLEHRTLVAATPVTLRIEAVGAASAAGLEAYPWILNRDTRAVSWRLDLDQATRTGALVETQDLVTLNPGTYDVYYTTYGNEVQHRSRGRDWDDEREAWRLVLEIVEGEAEVRREEVPSAADASALWTSSPLYDDERHEWVFRVEQPTTLSVEAVGEISDTERFDYGWIEEAVTGRHLWDMSRANTTPAGGQPSNRQYTGTIDLQPGFYRAVFATDGGHAYDAWLANPPWDPATWGMVLQTTTPEAVRPFDPWSMADPLLSLRQVPNNTLRSAQFTLTQPTPLAVYALGEISDSDSRYDYGWILNEDTQERVWEMQRDETKPAGGDENNREAVAFINLMPGTYTTQFRTDGSQAYGQWSNGAPTHPERWGITLFALGDTAGVEVTYTADQTSTVEEEGSSRRRRGLAQSEDPPAPPAPPTVAWSSLEGKPRLVSLDQIENEQRREQTFTLDTPTRLRIYALGELSTSSRYDYGWIEEMGSRRRVWEMRWDNTQAAGGIDRNRLFDGIIMLPPGRYEAHFRSDFSHAYNDFSDGAPADPDAWGLTIVVAEEDG